MSPDTPLTEQGFLTETDAQSAELAALKARNRQLEKINAALIERVESSSPSPSAPYAAFEHAVLLADQVRERTDALHRTLDELGAALMLAVKFPQCIQSDSSISIMHVFTYSLGTDSASNISESKKVRARP